MPYDASELLALALKLEAAAKVADAEASKAAIHRDFATAASKQKKADDARHYVKVCQWFAKQHGTTKAKPGKFTPPTWEELFAYIRSDDELKIWPTEDIRQWFDHFNSNGWLVGGKSEMKDWKSAARNGFRRWRTKKPNGAEQTRIKWDANPVGWLEFCDSVSQPRKDYKYAAEWVRNLWLERRASGQA
jgi:hypothetical protein